MPSPEYQGKRWAAWPRACLIHISDPADCQDRLWTCHFMDGGIVTSAEWKVVLYEP